MHKPDPVFRDTSLSGSTAQFFPLPPPVTAAAPLCQIMVLSLNVPAVSEIFVSKFTFFGVYIFTNVI